MNNFDADVIVVGSGFLGSFVALEIAKAGKTVIILEAGPPLADWKVNENFHTSPRKGNWNDPFGQVKWAPNSQTKGYITADAGGVTNLPGGTLRVAGGTSRHWTGSTWRFLPEDMQLKTLYGVGRDWPVSYEELEPYITEAEYAIGVNGVDSDDQAGGNSSYYPPRSKPFPLPPEAKSYMTQRIQMRLASKGMRVVHASCARASQPYKGRPGCIGNNMCQPNCPIGARYSGIMTLQNAVDAGAKLITNAVVDQIIKGENNKIKALSYLTPKGERKTLTARRFVIAGHGYETPKLLLMNDIANSSSMVGRNLMCHPGLNFNFMADEALWQGRGPFISGAILDRRNLPDRHTFASLHYDILNINWTTDIAGALLQKERLLGKPLDDKIRQELANYVFIQSMAEDLPEPTNFITLNKSWTDSLGLPGLYIHYRLNPYTSGLKARIENDYINMLQALNGERRSPPAIWNGEDHVMGTVIMGETPADSVVNKELRTHDHENLFLVTTGVFPSSSAVNHIDGHGSGYKGWALYSAGGIENALFSSCDNGSSDFWLYDTVSFSG